MSSHEHHIIILISPSTTNTEYWCRICKFNSWILYFNTIYLYLFHFVWWYIFISYMYCFSVLTSHTLKQITGIILFLLIYKYFFNIKDMVCIFCIKIKFVWFEIYSSMFSNTIFLVMELLLLYTIFAIYRFYKKQILCDCIVVFPFFLSGLHN